MASKLLKLQFVILFVLTNLNLFFFQFSQKFPDNALRITSNFQEFNKLVYYSTSILVFIGYFIGPWIFLSFFSFSILYSFVFQKRRNAFDVMHFFFNLGFCLIVSYLYLPIFVGEGLRNFLTSFLPNWGAFLSLIIFSLFFFLGFLRHFSELLSRPIHQIKYLIKKVISTANSPIFFAKRKISLLASLLVRPFESHVLEKKLSVNEQNLIHENDGRNSNEKPEEDLKDEISATEKENFSEGASKFIQVGVNSNKPSVSLAETEEKKGLTLSRRENLKITDKHDHSNFVERPWLTYDQKSKELIDQMMINKTIKKDRLAEEEYFEGIIKCLQDKFQEFKINGKIVNVLKGPVVDTFELELGAGVKVSKVTSITEDLSLALCGVLIRIVYPMKGKSTIGIEVPREPREMIFLGEILNSPNFKNTKHHLPLAMGKNAFGEVIVVDLASMPHMLVAGSTGAGKSVFVNTLLVSLLVKKSPQKMRLLLIDPKQLELSLYASLPHLLLPVLTDPVGTSAALSWACLEMERRYTLMKEVGVRNLEGFNEKLSRLSDAEIAKLGSIHNLINNQEDELPYLVIIVDEFADLILSKKGREIEESICRLAAKARAAGIHLVIATQRPSVDVITGLIKANFPTRISFRVTSSIDSRTILNSLGAEKLLGKGDMLYKYGIEMIRLHSAYVDENEIDDLMGKFDFGPLNYDQGALDYIQRKRGQEAAISIHEENMVFDTFETLSDDTSLLDDSLYREALRVVVEHKVASASMLQRKLKIGYNRAANLVDVLESEGVIGPQQGSKPRKVLIIPENQT